MYDTIIPNKTTNNTSGDTDQTLIEAIKQAPTRLLLTELVIRKEYELGILGAALAQLCREAA